MCFPVTSYWNLWVSARVWLLIGNIFLVQLCKMQDIFTEKWHGYSAFGLIVQEINQVSKCRTSDLIWPVSTYTLPHSGGSITAWLWGQGSGIPNQREEQTSSVVTLPPHSSLFIPHSDHGDEEKQPSEACCWHASEDISSRALSSNELHIRSFWTFWSTFSCQNFCRISSKVKPELILQNIQLICTYEMLHFAGWKEICWDPSFLDWDLEILTLFSEVT